MTQMVIFRRTIFNVIEMMKTAPQFIGKLDLIWFDTSIDKIDTNHINKYKYPY